MTERLGDDAEQVAKEMFQRGIPRNIAQQALDVAKQHGRFTIFALVDALTRIAQQVSYAGDRLEIDQKAASLLTLVA